MTTHRTRAGIDRPVVEDHGGLLRLALKLDALATGASGALSVAAAPVLDDLLGIPLALLLPVGLFLLAYAAFVWFVATRPRVSRTATWAVIAVNLLYAADCIVVAAAGWFPLTGPGVAFILFQAAAVALFAAAQLYGLRKAGQAG